MSAGAVLTPAGLRLGGRVLRCAVGRGGILADKREGDNATPRGRHRVTGCFWRADRLPRPAPWAQPIGPRDLWSDDPTMPDYNRLVRAPYPGSHERMRRADRLYDIVLTLDWNWPVAVPGRGSAIFVHRWRKPRHPTEGCITLALPDLAWLARNAPPGTEIRVP